MLINSLKNLNLNYKISDTWLIHFLEVLFFILYVYVYVYVYDTYSNIYFSNKK